MTKQHPWFVDERAIAFASLLLTKHAEVALRSQVAGQEEGLDLLVEILRDGKPTLRFFGVQIAASLDMPNPSKVDERICFDVDKLYRTGGLPLAIFAIGVRQPEGIYRWLVEPIVEEDDVALQPQLTGPWQSLDDAGVERLIDRVNAWYEALNGGPTAKPSNRRPKRDAR